MTTELMHSTVVFCDIFISRPIQNNILNWYWVLLHLVIFFLYVYQHVFMQQISQLAAVFAATIM